MKSLEWCLIEVLINNMPISPTNQAKNTISPQGAFKTGIYMWGDSLFDWGDSLATWGGLMLSPVNKVKNSITPTNETKS